ncbi:LamG domain-containing protein [Patescibacteria group bacterium]
MNFNHQKNKKSLPAERQGFTLIEILIVIVIIGILAAVVVITLAQSAKEKARIAAGQQFADSLRAKAVESIYGDSNEGHWLRFEDNIIDDWSSNAMTLNGASSYSNGINGKALEFNGSSTWILPNNATGYYNAEFYEKTVEMWFKADDTLSIQTLYDEGGSGQGFWVGIDSNQINVAARHGSVQVTLSYPLTDNKWHHVAASFNKGDLKLFFDDEEVGNVATGFPVGTSGFPAIGGHGNGPGIGATGSSSDAYDNGGPNYFDGFIDDFRVSGVGI